jgi:hypothetical protein
MPGNELNKVSSATRGSDDWLASTADIRFISFRMPVEAPRPVLTVALNPAWEDSWGEGQARAALREVEQGGALYSFEEVFGIPL